MSNGWLIQSDGLPYFGLYQTDLAGMTSSGLVGAGGEFILELDIALDGQPTQYSSPDEEHPLFSLYQWPLGPDADLLTLGVTPSGRLYGRGPGAGSGNLVQSGQGYLKFNGVRNVLSLNYIDSGEIQIRVDDIYVGGNMAATGGTPLPSSGRFSMFSLLNGANGLSRVPCRLYRASYYEDDFTNPTEWRLGEGGGVVVSSDIDPDTYPGVNADLTAQFRLPWGGYTRAWGQAAPTTNPAHAFRWRPHTEWQRVVRDKTVWARV